MVRTSTQQCEKTPLKKGPWSPDEDHKLIAYIQRYGIWNWSRMPKPAGKKQHIFIFWLLSVCFWHLHFAVNDILYGIACNLSDLFFPLPQFF